jgi:DNA-binding transcriptional LysR family regulator
MSDGKADLNQLIIFAKVVETRSFTAAGRELGLPKSTVSRKVAQLEERLGAVLLERTTRKLSLTEVGAAFYERCARISLEVDEAEHAVQGHRDPQGLLRLTAPPEFATACLSELVSEFLLMHPRVDIELELTDRAVDMIEEGVDLAIHVGPLVDAGSAARLLGPIPRYLVASPSYLQRRGIPERPQDLEHHDLVVLGNPRRTPTLELRGREGESVVIGNRPRLVANSVTTLRDAVLAGVGVGMLPAFRCAEELENGALRSFLHDWTHTDAPSHAVYPSSRHLSAKVRSFLDYLVARLQSEPGRFASDPLRGAPAGGSDLDLRCAPVQSEPVSVSVPPDSDSVSPDSDSVPPVSVSDLEYAGHSSSLGS